MRVAAEAAEAAGAAGVSGSRMRRRSRGRRKGRGRRVGTCMGTAGTPRVCRGRSRCRQRGAGARGGARGGWCGRMLRRGAGRCTGGLRCTSQRLSGGCAAGIQESE